MIFADHQNYQNALRGWSKHTRNKSNMAGGHYFEKSKNPPYLSNDWTYRHRILHVDAYWTS